MTELSIGISRLLEALLREIPVELVSLDVSIQHQAIGLVRFQLKLGGKDQHLLAEFIRLLQIADLKVDSSHSHEGIREASCLIGLDLLDLLAVLNLFAEIIDGDLVIAQAKTKISQGSQRRVESLEITRSKLEIQAAAEIVDRLVIVAITAIDQAQLVIRFAEPGDILLPLAHLESLVEIPRGAKVISSLEINPSQVIQDVHREGVMLEILSDSETPLKIIEGVGVISLAIKGAGDVTVEHA